MQLLSDLVPALTTLCIVWLFQMTVFLQLMLTQRQNTAQVLCIMQIIGDVCEVMFNMGGLTDHHKFLHKPQKKPHEILS